MCETLKSPTGMVVARVVAPRAVLDLGDHRPRPGSDVQREPASGAGPERRPPAQGPGEVRRVAEDAVERVDPPVLPDHDHLVVIGGDALHRAVEARGHVQLRPRLVDAGDLGTGAVPDRPARHDELVATVEGLLRPAEVHAVRQRRRRDRWVPCLRRVAFVGFPRRHSFDLPGARGAACELGAAGHVGAVADDRLGHARELVEVVLRVQVGGVRPHGGRGQGGGQREYDGQGGCREQCRTRWRRHV